MSVEIHRETIDHPENPLQIEIYPARGTYSICWPTNKSYEHVFYFIDEMNVDRESDIVIRPSDGSKASLSVVTLEELPSREFDFTVDLLRLHTVDYNLVWENKEESNSVSIISDFVDMGTIKSAFRATTTSELSPKNTDGIKNVLERKIE